MARNLELALTLAAKDTASKVLKKAMQDTIAQTKAVEKADDQLGKSQKQNSDSAIQASKALRSEYQRSASARSTLGIRAERDIQREIQLTQAAYNRLTRAGVMSANEQSRAFEAMTSRVSKLRGELNSTGQSMSRLERAKGWGSNAMAIAGGVTAAGAVLAQPVSNQMTYERRLADMSNTAFADQGIAGRKAGMQQMDSLIRDSVKTGGGNKENAADTLNALLASGAVDFGSAKTLLPVIQKYATASGSDPKDLAQIAIRLKQTFGIQDQDIGKALNMALAAGQAGSFELSDQAKYLPAQLAAASNLGMKGLGDFSTILGLNQAAAITSGDSSQAGVNVTDLLLKINSKDAARAAARVKINGHGIDLPGTLSAARAKGINPLEAFNRVVDKVVGNNPEYQKLESRLKTAKGGERQEIMEAQKKLLEGSGIGQIIADQQALFALVGYRANKKYFNDVVSGANQQRDLPDGQRAGDVNYGLIQDTNDYKTDQLKNVRDFSEMDSIKSLSDLLGDLSKELTDYSDKYPELTTALSGATTGIKVMTAAAFAFAGLRFLSGGNPLSGGGASSGGTPVPGGGGVSFPGLLMKTAGVGMAVTGLATLTSNEEDDELENGPAKWAAIRAKYSQETIDAARKRFQPWYQFGSGYAEENQQWLDRYTSEGPQPLAGSGADSWWSKPSTIGAGQNGAGVPSYLQAPTQQAPFLPIQIHNTLTLDGKVVAESTNEVNASQANRGSTGGY